MRQRKIKNLDEKLGSYNHLIVENPGQMKGKWRNSFDGGPIYLEIGCGKGQFISTMAQAHRDWNFIGVEGNQSVVFKALEKVGDSKAADGNVKFILNFIDKIDDFFEEGELDGIFLNFSDPWPKARHAKRRLTYGKKLLEYRNVIKSGGFIRFKTDNDQLFEFTLEQIHEHELEIQEMTRDLHNSQYMEGNVTTEYEDKFSSKGKNINYVSIRA